MQWRTSLLAVALMLSAGPGEATPSDKEQADLSIRVGETVAMTINDHPVRFRMAPDAVSVPTVNADAVEKIGLKPSMIGYVYVIGSVRIAFRTDDVRYRAGDTSFKRRTAFSNRQVVDGADGIAGPGSFPFSASSSTCASPRRAIARSPFPSTRRWAAAKLV